MKEAVGFVDNHEFIILDLFLDSAKFELMIFMCAAQSSDDAIFVPLTSLSAGNAQPVTIEVVVTVKKGRI